MKKKNIVAIIPARGGSKSIPGKNIASFCSKPLIAWTITQALASKYIDKVYVSTDDKKIARISEKYGAEIIDRPRLISNDTSSSEDALLHALSKIEKRLKVDLVVFLQATSPCRTENDIDNAVKKMLPGKVDSLFSVTEPGDLTLWQNKNGNLNSLTFDYKNRGRRQDRAPLLMENGSIYIFKPEILKKYNNRLGGRIAVYKMKYWQSFQIDEPQDLEICEYFMKTKVLKGSGAPAIEDAQLVVYDFDGVLTNNKIFLREDGLESAVFNRSDGLAISLINKLKLPQIILTTETNKIVEMRAKKLRIPVIKGVKDKKKVLSDYCRKNNISLKRVIYVGNDINDLGAMKMVGHSVCPADACDEIKNISKIVLNAKGGDGTARELLNYIKRKKHG